MRPSPMLALADRPARDVQREAAVVHAGHNIPVLAQKFRGGQLARAVDEPPDALVDGGGGCARAGGRCRRNRQQQGRSEPHHSGTCESGHPGSIRMHRVDRYLARLQQVDLWVGRVRPHYTIVYVG